MMVVMPRKVAFKVAWKLFWFATGTPRVGMELNLTEETLSIVGSDLIPEEEDHKDLGEN